jgi:hypothetical protein
MSLQEQLAFFVENGYAVIDALSADELETLRAAADAELNPLPLSHTRSRGVSAPDVLRRTSAFDLVLDHPRVAPLCRRLIGPRMRCVGLSVGERAPHPAPGLQMADGELHTQVWHREDDGNVHGAAENEFAVPSLQVMYYLDDVDETTHVFSIVPESLAEKRALPTVLRPPPEWEQAGEESAALIDPTAAAGPGQQLSSAWEAQSQGRDAAAPIEDGRLVVPIADEMETMETWTDTLGREQVRLLFLPQGRTKSSILTHCWSVSR